MSMLDRFPIPSFRFDVEIKVNRSKTANNSFKGGFQEISGLGATVEFLQGNKSDDPYYNYKVPKKVKPTDVKFKKGVFKGASTAHDLLEAFGLYSNSFNDETPFADIVISVKDASGQVALVWIMEQAYPSAWEFGALNAMATEVLLETITFSCKRMRMSYTQS